MSGGPEDFTQRLVGATGTRMFIREYGRADEAPLVLLHGFPQTGHCWRGVLPFVLPGRRVIVPDLPGYGASEPPMGYDARSLADTVASGLRTAGVARAAIVGHDWGGSLAFTLALHHPDLVERLVVVNAPFRSVDYRRAWHMLAFSLPVLPELAFTLAGGRIIAASHRLLAAEKDAWTEEDLEIYKQAYKGLDKIRPPLSYYRAATGRALSRLLPRRTGPRSTARIECPTMIVWGERDPVLPPSLVDGIVRDIPQARVELIPDAGHFVPEERPEVLGKLLADFLG